MPTFRAQVRYVCMVGLHQHVHSHGQVTQMIAMKEHNILSQQPF